LQFIKPLKSFGAGNVLLQVALPKAFFALILWLSDRLMRECPICKSCFPDDVNHCPNDGEPTTQSIEGEPVLDGRYLLEKRLGQGGMGVVFKARHVFLKTQHAIKVILPDLVGNDPMLVTRFRQEALAAAAIRHQNIIAVTDFGVARGKMPFLVMEFVSGESLHDVLAREKALSPVRAIEIMSPICAGVAAAHRQGIVHRDLKPLNVMIQEGLPINEAVKILDFGLAKIKSGELLGSFVQAKTTGLMGSPYYMAPEQWADEEPDAQSDVYSLGVLFFQMLAGDVPFKGNSFPAIMKKHVSELPPPFSDYKVQIPPQIEAVVRHALEKDRHNRTKSVEDFINELRAALTASTSGLKQTVLGTTPGLIPPTGSLPTEKLTSASIRLQTDPPHASVFINGSFIGASDNTGKLVIEGVPPVVHRIRISHDGFQDWENDLDCQSGSVTAHATLKNLLTTTAMSPGEQQNLEQRDIGIRTTRDGAQQVTGFDTSVPHPQKPGGATQVLQQGKGTRPLEDVAVASDVHAQSQQIASSPDMQASQNWQATNPMMHSTIAPAPPSKLPVVLSLVALAVVIGFVGVFGIYKFVIEPRMANSNGPITSRQTPTPVPKGTPDMAFVKGGKFMIGRNGSRLEEGPPYEVNVKDFFMDKTEVTNSEYFDFVINTGYTPPQGWMDGKAPPGQENFPVVFVSLEDAEKFAEWRSKKYGVRYRLPTEQEWEYAARNGAKQTLYPWGNDLDKNKAIIGTALRAVGSVPGGADDWGVMDLIGNVEEWTSTQIFSYPGSKATIDPEKAKDVYVTRGSNFAVQDWKFTLYDSPAEVTSTLRIGRKKDDKRAYLGFRLVRSATVN
jgi:serine/threonine-protein kinase